jgi:hypothetical protein
MGGSDLLTALHSAVGGGPAPGGAPLGGGDPQMGMEHLLQLLAMAQLGAGSPAPGAMAGGLAPDNSGLIGQMTGFGAGY